MDGELTLQCCRTFLVSEWGSNPLHYRWKTGCQHLHGFFFSSMARRGYSSPLFIGRCLNPAMWILFFSPLHQMPCSSVGYNSTPWAHVTEGEGLCDVLSRIGSCGSVFCITSCLGAGKPKMPSYAREALFCTMLICELSIETYTVILTVIADYLGHGCQAQTHKGRPDAI